jgi:hypothetical protein
MRSKPITSASLHCTLCFIIDLRDWFSAVASTKHPTYFPEFENNFKLRSPATYPTWTMLTLSPI